MYICRSQQSAKFHVKQYAPENPQYQNSCNQKYMLRSDTGLHFKTLDCLKASPMCHSHLHKKIYPAPCPALAKELRASPLCSHLANVLLTLLYFIARLCCVVSTTKKFVLLQFYRFLLLKVVISTANLFIFNLACASGQLAMSPTMIFM